MELGIFGNKYDVCDPCDIQDMDPASEDAEAVARERDRLATIEDNEPIGEEDVDDSKLSNIDDARVVLGCLELRRIGKCPFARPDNLERSLSI